MNNISIIDLFKKTDFNIDEIKEKLFKINLITKTRPDVTKKLCIEQYGIEQSFLLYYIAKTHNAKNFVEIGTGRGTTSFSIALQNNIENIDTFDIIPFDTKFNTAVNFKPFYGSIKDLHDLIPYEEKKKINFLNISKLNSTYLAKNKNKFDMAFIDGNHSDKDIIMKDFLNCLHLTKKDGIIVFDDYGNFPVVTNVINDIVKQYKQYNYFLVPFRGHIFMTEKSCFKSGEVILFKDPKIMSKFNLTK